MRLIFDIESDGLLDTITTVWVAVTQDIDTGEIQRFTGDDLTNGKFKDHMVSATVVAGHNIIEFDLPAIDRLLDIRIAPDRVLDTLILSKLHWQARPGGHSLEAWGERLGFPKIEFDKWHEFSEEMCDYCRNDVLLNRKVYDYLIERMPDDVWKKSIRLEHDMAFICRDMHDGGFKFDIDAAGLLQRDLISDLAELDGRIEKSFPPRLRAIREVTPKLTKFGTISRTSVPRDFGRDLSTLSAGSAFTWCELVPFNAGSPKQVIERLNEFGWQPVDKTKGHLKAEKERGKGSKERLAKFKEYGWMLNENNLATLPASAPEAARLLVKRGLVAARLRTLTEWFGSYNPHTGRVHGTFDTLGTWTHRLAHRKPNLGNVAAKKSIKYKTPELKKLATDLGGTMRGLWHADDGCYLVSADMDAAHLRIFAHLVSDPVLSEAIDRGDKANGTDVHTLNMHKLGGICADRDLSKTFIYTFLNGGGYGKVASIFGCSMDSARVGLDAFIESYPKLAQLKADVFPAWAKRGYFVGLDGRKVACDSAHQMMAGILQNYEAVLMKEANVLWRKRLDEEGIRYTQVNLVHDEFVTEVRGSYADALKAGQIQAECITEVGVRYNLICPLRSKPQVGKTWLEIH